MSARKRVGLNKVSRLYEYQVSSVHIRPVEKGGYSLRPVVLSATDHAASAFPYRLYNACGVRGRIRLVAAHLDVISYCLDEVNNANPCFL